MNHLRNRTGPDESLSAVLKECGLTPAVLDLNPAVIYILRPDLCLDYSNLAWDKFALENDGETLIRPAGFGVDVLEVVPEPLEQFYREGFTRVQQSGESWTHEFECSSPELYRVFQMRVLRLPGSYLLVENSLRTEVPHDMDPSAQLHPCYLNESGIVTLCCHCRRTLRVGPQPNRVWDWVPYFLLRRKTAKISHGLCETCRVYFYNHLLRKNPSVQG